MRAPVRFATYGALGLGAELTFTGAHGLLAGRGLKASARTSPWMFPVYGLIQPLFEPVHDAMRDRTPAPVRVAAYAAGFLTVEYGAGRLFRLVLAAGAPWDYSHARWSVDGLIRFDYAPIWGLAGLGLEWVHDRLTGPERSGAASEPAAPSWRARRGARPQHPPARQC
ncbi:MAG TPA: hypothetical protein VF984_12275 [Actinomycetota bacterium]